ncbi:MAG: DUF934 domain-containing protein [Rhodospirillales bacterium]|jgi:uncharacterized protein (DUF934 family)|nr:DUF934 domain-containing protein [Rhodospirillales bacterium]
MPLLRNGHIALDQWVAVGDDEALPEDAPIIVSLARWQTERGKLVDEYRQIGIRLKGGDQASDIANDLPYFDLIAIEFASVADGRGYSTARLLRGRHDFTGELRAVGHIIRDVFPFLHRCGFDAVETRNERDAKAWRESVGAIKITYQPATDKRLPTTVLRHLSNAVAAE